MNDHDQRFKTLLHEFLAEFFEAFFPVWKARFDFSSVEWLDKEAIADPPQGERRYLDIVARLRATEPIPTPFAAEAESWLALLHIEIESADSVKPLRSRMADYYMLLRRRYGLPVLPIGLYLQVGLEGIGRDVYEESVYDLPLFRFEYLYVGLPGLPAEKYVRGDNPLAVAFSTLMNQSPEQRGRLAAEALRRIQELPNSAWRRFLLGETVMAYLPLEGEQRTEFERLLDTEPYREAKTMENTLLSHWREEFREEGRQEGHREALAIVLKQRFGRLDPQVIQRLEALPLERVLELLEQALAAGSLQELGLMD
ncbi:MAG: hypothetical protein JNM56_13235 [Planctomycetia bacterium]|nr:hypothetical protein [Planctomycetia bacterium]